MIIKIETEIIGSFTIEKDMKVKHPPFDIDIHFEEETNKFLISICKKVIDYSSYLPKITTIGQKINQIIFPSQNFLEEQITILQHIESFGTLDKEFERVNWQNCSIEWIPETEKENEEITIRKYYRNISYDTEHHVLSRDWLFKTVIYRKRLNHLALPFSFFREGANLFHNFQYQNSFLKSYLMIEGFFGNGQHKNEGMKKEFKKSKILNYAINETIQHLENIKGKHYEWLTQNCKKYNKEVDKDGVIHILVEQRGNLSHFSLTNTHKHNNPFKDKDYESLALIATAICKFSAEKLRFEVLYPKHNNKNSYL